MNHKESLEFWLERAKEYWKEFKKYNDLIWEFNKNNKAFREKYPQYKNSFPSVPTSVHYDFINACERLGYNYLMILLEQDVKSTESVINSQETSSSEILLGNKISEQSLDTHSQIKKEIDKDYDLCECGHNKQEHGFYLGNIIDSCHHKIGSHFCKCLKFRKDKQKGTNGGNDVRIK